jgi:hypothetical protein
MGAIDWGAIDSSQPQAQPTGAIDWNAIDSAQPIQQQTTAQVAPLPIKQIVQTKKIDVSTPPSWVEQQLAKLPSSFADANPSGNFLGRLTQGMADPEVGIGQKLVNIVGGAGNLLGVKNTLGNDVNTAVNNQLHDYEQSRKEHGDTGFDWNRLGGNLISPVSLLSGKALPTGTPTSFMNAAKQGSALGAGFSLTNPITDIPKDSSFLQESAKQGAAGAVSGGVASPTMYKLASMIAPNISGDVKTLLDSGVTPTAGQILGGGFKRIEDGLTSVPVLGDMIKNAQIRSANDLQKSSINRALTPIGQTLPNGVTGRDAISHAYNALGNAYDSVLNKIGAVIPDQQFHNDLNNLTSLTQNLPHSAAEQFQRIINNEITGRINNGAMTSEGLKAAESNLGNIAKGYLSDPNYDTRQLGSAVQEAQNQIRNMLGRVKPQYAPELAAVNKGYANLLRPMKAASYVGAENGNFTPAQLQTAVKSFDSSKGDRNFAMGNALMQDLSDAGKNVLGGSVPDSGTPFRHAVQAGGAGLIASVAGHSVLPAAVTGAMIPAAATAGLMSLPYTATGQKLAAALLAKRPDMAYKLGNFLKSASPFAGLPVIYPALQAIK